MAKSTTSADLRGLALAQVRSDLRSIPTRYRRKTTGSGQIHRAASIEDLRRQALRRTPRVMFDFVDGGAQDEVTLRDNQDVFSRIAIVPHVLADVSETNSTIDLFGSQLSCPIIGGPTGLTGLIHTSGELALAKALTDAGTAYVLASMASYSIEEVKSASVAPLWFQLYVWRDRGLVSELLGRAKSAGYQALVVTVDIPRAGARERDVRNSFGIPPRITIRTCLDAAQRPRWTYGLLRHPRMRMANLEGSSAGRSDGVGLAAYINRQFDPSLTWSDLSTLREQWDRPLILKGILHPEDARRAVSVGVDGIIVSNHGGRQLDHAVAALDALPSVVDSVDDRVAVLLDGGVRRGTDVFKAIALGARACLAARPFVYGLAAGGEAGAARAIDILASEFRLAMSLAGCRSVKEIAQATLARRSHDGFGSIADTPLRSEPGQGPEQV
jgi:isopentenyl diphosphate isomerase/L-lactate dehydrogenase-like FMN-dependent dehydrogenase